jgi:hypothetical protein
MPIVRGLSVLLMISVLVTPDQAQAQRRGGGARSGGGARPSGGGSRPSAGGSSRPSSSGAARPSGGSSKPPASSSGSKPPSSSGSGFSGGTTKSATGSSAGATSSKSPPAAPGSASQATGGNAKPSGGTAGKFAGGSSGATPSATAGTKPTGTGTASAKAQSQRREESTRSFVETQRATAPPRSEATVGGRSVKVEAQSKGVNDLRGRPSSYVQPAERQRRIVNHVTIHNYSHPYDYYWSRPVGFGIGPYSLGFWWMMMEWNASRRAEWLYHNQSRISAEAYAEAARDADVQKRLAALEAEKKQRDPDYVDPEFAENPSDQYDQDYVEAAYNPTVRPAVAPPTAVVPARSGFGWLESLLLTLGGLAGLWWMVFRVRWGR